jgi:hypothetical protein
MKQTIDVSRRAPQQTISRIHQRPAERCGDSRLHGQLRDVRDDDRPSNSDLELRGLISLVDTLPSGILTLPSTT